MASRPNWKGHLRLSLVSCPVALFSATTEAGRVRLHTYNKETGNRVRRIYVDADTGDAVERDDEIKGYEVGPEEAVLITDEELDEVEIESNRIIDIGSFVAAREIDPLYLDTPYYLAPDDSVGADAFAVIRDAMAARKVAGLGRVVLYRRERIVLIEPRGRGLVATTLRYADEVRDAEDYFAEIGDVEATEDMVELAEHIIAKKTGAFTPEKFDDRYDDALKALIERKRAGETIHSSDAPRRASNVVSLMDALRRSVDAAEGEGGKGGKGGSVARKPKAAAAATATKSRAAEPEKASKPAARKTGAAKKTPARRKAS